MWDDERDALLRKCIDDANSFSEAAIILNAKFNTKLSRNACIGRAHRVGIKSRLGPEHGSAKHRPRQHRPRQPKPAVMQRRAVAPGVVLKLRIAAVEPLHIGLSDLSALSCRYPYGDGPFTFCGHLARAGSSYCNHHYSLTLGEGRKPRSGDRELRIRSFVRSDRRAIVEAAE